MASSLDCKRSRLHDVARRFVLGSMATGAAWEQAEAASEARQADEAGVAGWCASAGTS